MAAPMGRVGRVVLALALLAGAFGLYTARRRFIASFLPRGSGGAPPPELALPGDPVRARAGLPPARFVRVALLDGVDRTTALGLPSWSALCSRGLELTVDVGFPTVSLPVQSVLWTGLTQQQTGVEFVGTALTPPLADSLPARVPDSAAVAESHPHIVQSIGFAHAWPSLDTTGPALAAWEAGFPRAAADQVASDARLVFVHMLAPDSAGHASGRDSAAFREAAAGADALLGRLVAIDRASHGEATRWFVLADHGHRGAGGHGDAEPSIRLVRACIAGGGGLEPAIGAVPGELVHLVDLSRAIADSLGLAPDRRSAGRPLWAALSVAPQPGATLPRPAPLRWLLAAVLMAASALGTWIAARRRVWRLPWWWLIALASLVAIEKVPSLSASMVFKPLGQAIYLAALPGLAWLAITAGASVRRTSPWRMVAGQLAVPAAAALSALVLCWREPPLVPLWTAHASVFLVLLFSGAVVVALAVLAGLVPSASDRAPPSETPGTST